MATSSPRMEKEKEKEKEVQPTTTNATNRNTNTVTVVSILSRAPPRKRGPLSVLLASLFVAKNRPKKPVEKQPSGRAWKSLICGIRPLHHLEEGPPRTPRTIPPPGDSFHDVALPPPSPSCSSSSSLSSRYASAVDLQALDNSDNDNNTDDDDDDGVTDDGPNLIDMQAEEFIARFYAQMKLQRSESMEMRRN